MRCPLCNTAMREIDRRGVRIDVCPECRGVWLDGGELDKLLATGESWEAEYRSSHPLSDRDYHHHPKKKKKGFLGEVFDIFD
ncbi:MAG TPA: zf-TFIIB domain-containing protein [Symbiobacteriaceae bacterium]|nr:zf-TFIIB domain-containing protein [Symbiobacteriaceae bacterium]